MMLQRANTITGKTLLLGPIRQHLQLAFPIGSDGLNRHNQREMVPQATCHAILLMLFKIKNENKILLCCM